MKFAAWICKTIFFIIVLPVIVVMVLIGLALAMKG